MLKEHQETWGYSAQSDSYFLSADTNKEYINARPSATIIYRNQTGIEDYLSYHVQEAGRAGTIYTNDYNGNLTLIHPDTSTPGNLMPVSIYHVYNTNDKTENIGYGNGFRLNLSQTLEKVPEITTKEYIRYTDEDGTRHYFYKTENNEYKDEDGLGLTLTLASNVFTMTDKEGNIQTYQPVNSDKWYLKQIKNTEGQSITINCNSSNLNLIDSVIDGTGKQINFTYTNGLLTSIKELTGESIQYGYSNSFLTNITYKDNKKVWYSYENNLLYHIRNIDNSAVKYSFYATNPNKVKRIEEYGTDETIGNYIDISYGENTSKIVDNKNFEDTISFDNMGRQISIASTDDTKKEAFGQSYSYGNEKNNKNKLLCETNIIKPVNNLILNGSAENGTNNFTLAQWGTNKGNFSITEETAYVGKNSFKLETDTSSNIYPLATTDVYNVTRNTKHTFSVKIKGEIYEKANTNEGIVLLCEYKKNSGENIDIISEPLTITKDWETYSMNFELPEDANGRVILAVGIKNAKAQIYFDALQLEKGEVGNPFNLINNGGFDAESSYWTPNTQTNTSIDKTVTYENKSVLKLEGEASKDKNYCQKVATQGKGGDTYQIGALVKTKGTPNYDGKKSCIMIDIKNDDGTSNWESISINPSSNEWQYVSLNFIAPKPHKEIIIYLCFYRNANTIYFDDIYLYKDMGTNTYTYDNKGNIISTQDLAKQNSTFQYNGSSDLLKSINPKGGKYTYEYDYINKHRLLNATNTMGMKYEFGYNQSGNATVARVKESKTSDEIINNKTYYIKFASSDKYFDIAWGSTTNSANVYQWNLCKADNQKFLFTDVGEGYFKISPKHAPNQTLTINKYNNIMQWPWEQADNQKWKLVPNEDGTYKIVSKAKGEEYCLTLANDGKDLGSNIELNKWEGKLSQHVLLYDVEGSVDPTDTDFIENNEIYYIKSYSSNLYLQQEADASESSVVQKEFKQGNRKQLWKISRDENNIYHLTNAGSTIGRTLDVKHGANANDQIVQMFENTLPNKAQEWKIEKNPDGTFAIITNIAGGDRRITIYGNSVDSGAKIVLYDNNGSNNQKFYLEKANMQDLENEATYKIKVKYSNLYMGINGTNIEQQAASNSSNQQWVIKDLHNGYYNIVSKANPNNVMDVYCAGVADGTNIQICVAWGGLTNHAQQFEILRFGARSYVIRTRVSKSKSSLDIALASKEPGGNIQEWVSNGTIAQEFYFEKVSSPDNRKFIQTNAEYSADGKYMTKSLDDRANATTYTYNENTGTVNSIKDAKNKETKYTYDNLDRITNVSKTAGSTSYQNGYAYENDRLKTITHNGFNYSFLYNTFGNVQQVKVGNQTLITNNYEENNGNLLSILYGNNQTISYGYDKFNRTIKKTATDGTYEYAYNNRNNLAKVTDGVNNNITNYTYDLGNRIEKIDKNNEQTIRYTYDNNSNINLAKYGLKTTINEVTYNYDRTNRINSIKLGTKALLQTNYDKLSRISNKQIKAGNKTYETRYAYLETSAKNRTTTLVECMQNGTDQVLNYTYDANGNIETISKADEQQVKYYYDELNQLVRENNKEQNRSYTYAYDAGGNIVNKKEYAYTTTNTLPSSRATINYTYANTNWKDQLTNYNGKNILYDEIGNPTYYDTKTYTWKNGRQLGSIKSTEKKLDITYQYNDEGIRTEKTVNGVTTKYYLEGSKVIYEQTGSNTIYYDYDEQGNVIGLNYNKTQYYYVRNLQGDIIGILDSNLTQVVTYTYDSWGNVTSIKDQNGDIITSAAHIGNINPYRYRGYRYDAETSLYYLQSRYYNPIWGRFLNADSLISTGQGLLSHNMYAYGNNNPIMNIDPDGHAILIGLIFGACAAISAVVTFASQTYQAYRDGYKPNYVDIVARSIINAGTFYGAGIVASDIGNAIGSNKKSTKSNYSNLKDPTNVGAGKDFTATQKVQIIKQNQSVNGGVVKSDLSGQVLVAPQKSSFGITPSPNEWQIDHIIPKVNGGTNSFLNAQVLSRQENRLKWDR